MDYPVEDVAMIIALHTELDKVPTGQWGLFRPQLYINIPQSGL